MIDTKLYRIKQDYTRTYRTIKTTKNTKLTLRTIHTLKGLTRPYSTIQYNGKLNRTVQDHSGLYRIERNLANKFLFAVCPPAINF